MKQIIRFLRVLIHGSAHVEQRERANRYFSYMEALANKSKKRN